MSDLHKVRVNMTSTVLNVETLRQPKTDKWQVALDDLILQGVRDVSVKQSFDGPPILTLELIVDSVKGFDK